MSVVERETDEPRSSMHGITGLSAGELARRIAAGTLSSVEAVEAHIRRIEAVNPALNAVAFPLFAQARGHAVEADRVRSEGAALGPLHGVPVTIKEQHAVAGTPATLGLPGRADVLSPQDGPLVARLRAAGAVLVATTNVPQLLLYNETDNPLYGRTNNPWDLTRAPGGSSGGEAALVAAMASPLGLASDIGGSIRCPAHAVGISGIKPTAGRLTNLDTPRGVFADGQEAILSQPGPLARRVSDLTLAMRVLAAPGQEAIDPSVPPVPWTEPDGVRVEGLRVGVYTDDGFFGASPSVRRAVTDAARALRERGVRVIEFAPPDVPGAMRLFLGILAADAGAGGIRTLGHDKRDPRIASLLQVAGLPGPLRPVVAGLAALLGQKRLAQTVRDVGGVSTDAYWHLTAQRAAYRRRFLTALDASGIDAVICPPHALPALTHGASYFLSTAASYSMLYNLLGLPAGTVAATRVRAGEESDRRPGPDLVERTAVKVERGSVGLPLGVQVAARHWREDVVLALMAALEGHFESQPDYPSAPL